MWHDSRMFLCVKWISGALFLRECQVEVNVSWKYHQQHVILLHTSQVKGHRLKSCLDSSTAHNCPHNHKILNHPKLRRIWILFQVGFFFPSGVWELYYSLPPTAWQDYRRSVLPLADLQPAPVSCSRRGFRLYPYLSFLHCLLLRKRECSTGKRRKPGLRSIRGICGFKIVWSRVHTRRLHTHTFFIL